LIPGNLDAFFLIVSLVNFLIGTTPKKAYFLISFSAPEMRRFRRGVGTDIWIFAGKIRTTKERRRKGSPTYP
jgi:hypothetical protein